MRIPLTILACASILGLTHLREADGSGPTPCESTDALGPSRDLYCIDLVPIVALDGVRATFELNRIPSVFGTNVTKDGAQVYEPRVRIEGLPDPASFADGARTWVAWMTSPTLFPYVKLGTVGNGETTLPPIDWSKFLVLVTAEPSADVTAPDGRVALRGFSASSRMQPPDMIEFVIGAARSTDDSTAHDHEAHQQQWPHPQMPKGLQMMPAEMRLPPPAVTPFLPADAPDIPHARRREIVRLADGDTLVLTAAPVKQTVNGRTFVGYGYNGQVPGPVLWAEQDATIHVRYRNRIDWPTTVHWHGVRLENRFDGAAGLTQAPVPPMGEFDYTVHLEDAGLYWYHPHAREDVLKDLGLFGNIMVQSPDAAYFGPGNREEFLVLDDLAIANDGSVLPFGSERSTHALMGRFGSVPLLNGITDWSLDVNAGEVVRFLMTNVSNARTFNVSFGDAQVKVLGSDVGNFEREERVESVVVAPAERYIVHVRFPTPGRYAIENRVVAIDHTFGRFFEQVDTLGFVNVSATPARPDLGASFDTLRAHAGVIAEIDRIREHFDRPPDRRLLIRMEANGLPFVVDRFMRFDSVYFHPVEWSGTMPMMNWNTTTSEVAWIMEDPDTGLRNMDIDWSFDVGEVVKIRIANVRETLHAMQHPIHFHGQRFLVLEQNGVRNTNLAWKDTFLLPAGSTADILLEISNPGVWMAHCHISEHLEAGMMMHFTAR